jgi:hypothetical protein
MAAFGGEILAFPRVVLGLPRRFLLDSAHRRIDLWATFLQDFAFKGTLLALILSVNHLPA